VIIFIVGHDNTLIGLHDKHIKTYANITKQHDEKKRKIKNEIVTEWRVDEFIYELDLTV